MYHGGIPDSSFFPRLIGRWGSSTQEIEDLETEVKIHPFFDAFWESKRAQLDKIVLLEYSHVYLGYVGLAASYIGGVLAPPQLMDFYLPISQVMSPA